MYGLLHQLFYNGRSQGQLYSGGKTSWISDFFGFSNSFFIGFRKAIDKILGPVPEISTEVDDYGVIRILICFQKRLSLAMGETQKHGIYAFHLNLVGKDQAGFPDQIGMDFFQLFAFLAIAMDGYQFTLGMVDQQADQFSSCISCSPYDGCSYLIHRLALKLN